VKRQMKTWIAAAAALLACGSACADITIGVTLPLTGPASGLGIPMRNGFKLWPDTLAGEKVKLVERVARAPGSLEVFGERHARGRIAGRGCNGLAEQGLGDLKFGIERELEPEHDERDDVGLVVGNQRFKDHGGAFLVACGDGPRRLAMRPATGGRVDRMFLGGPRFIFLAKLAQAGAKQAQQDWLVGAGIEQAPNLPCRRLRIRDEQLTRLFQRRLRIGDYRWFCGHLT